MFKKYIFIYLASLSFYTSSLELAVPSGQTKDVSVSRFSMKNYPYVCSTEEKFQANLKSNTADLDLYIREDKSNTIILYDCKSANSGNDNEECSLNIQPQMSHNYNTLYVGVFGYEKGSGKLTAGCVSSLMLPCLDCGYSGPFDRDWKGDGTSHLGKDYPAFVGDSVRAIADGIVMKVESSIAGFGGIRPTAPGPAVIIKHKKANGNEFYALYGHVASNLNVGQKINKSDVVGTVDHFYAGPKDPEDESPPQDWPHLHFGIWDSEEDFPASKWGYSTDNRKFVNPVTFLEQTESMSIQ